MEWITAYETPIRQWLTLHKDFERLSKEEITEITVAFDRIILQIMVLRRHKMPTTSQKKFWNLSSGTIMALMNHFLFNFRAYKV